MPKEIISVDDDADILFVIKSILGRYGYKVTSDQTGEILNKFDPANIGLILLDINLEKADGRELCSTLKNQTKTKNIPVILVSATDNLKEIYLSSGAIDYLCKPFDFDELVTKVKKNILP